MADLRVSLPSCLHHPPPSSPPPVPYWKMKFLGETLVVHKHATYGMHWLRSSCTAVDFNSHQDYSGRNTAATWMPGGKNEWIFSTL